MTSIVTTALMGFFVWTSLGAPIAEIAQTEVDFPALKTLSVAMTGYNAVPEQTDGDPFTTASGAYSNPNVVAARSVDLKEELPFGTVIQVVVNGTSTAPCGLSKVEDYIGLRVIADSMHPRKRNQIDILFESAVPVGSKTTNPAKTLGVCKNVEIKIVGHVSINKIPKTQAELKAALGEATLAVNK